MKTSPDVTAYLAQLPEEEKSTLETIRRQIRRIMPEGEERLSRSVPFFYYKGKRAVGFRSSKTHLSFFIMEGNALKQYRSKLSSYKNSSTVIEFSPQKPLDPALIELLLRARMKEIDQQTGNKK